MSDELKPCPFCGSDASINSNGPWFWVGCTNDECQVEPATVSIGTRESQIAAWNRRAAEGE